MMEPIPGQITDDHAINQADSREAQGLKVIRLLDKLGADKVFDCEKNKRLFIQELDFESFKKLLYSFNAIIRNIPAKEKGADGKTVYLKGFIDSDFPPKHEDKEKLLAVVFENIKQMNEDGRDLKDIALLIGASINALHMFNDANGRTSRLVYTLLANGYIDDTKNTDFIKNILGKHGREVVDIAPSILYIHEIDPIIEDEINNSINPKPIYQRSWLRNEQIIEILQSKECNEEDIDFVLKHLCHGRQGFLALEKYLFSKGILDNYVKSYVESMPELLHIDFDKVIQELNLEDIEEIKKIFWKIKKQRVEMLIDMISCPDKYQSREEAGKTAKQYFEDTILETSMQNN